MTYETHTYSLIVKPVGEPLMSERTTIIGLADEGDGPYVEIEQHARFSGRVGITFDEWPFIKEAVDKMMLFCQPQKPVILYRHPKYSAFTWDGKGDKPDWMKHWIDAGNDPMDCRVS